ncbi:hypothetical protein BDV27DRAFT_121850 [Aspergillus caelatus]|uniref:TLC domain-containing protein n=1 Tax=Aspergillus caelatus TaxID=61420 RepID=A0A5N7AHR5_9EURO|nr:uncharacterized protein BDV27DRAFT_121850 [Aspergillus caelatus]KAE8368706.1 hypothetical protein BDV27DRAFT_121850 [Aspergillus caelatus]
MVLQLFLLFSFYYLSLFFLLYFFYSVLIFFPPNLLAFSLTVALYSPHLHVHF